MTQKNVCIIGSGNWGSAIAKIIGNNVKERPEFNSTVKMYMYEELVDGKKLTEIVNSIHENVKYLPGIKLPENVVAISNLIKASTDADILVFVLPHQFIREICKTLKDVVKSQTIGVSLIKGFEITSQGINLVSRLIEELLNIECAVLMGANLAHEVAEEKFCETTIGAKNESTGKILKLLFKTSYFRCTIVRDADTVELCGALKNVVAIGAGIVDGLNMGDNTKAAVIRLGLMEMISFTNYFFPGAQLATFFESCGVADLIATCHGGRNRLLGECVVESKKSIGELEEEILHGQSFQGPLVAKEVFKMLKEKKMEKSYPLFTAVHLICQRELEPRKFTACLRNHPEHM